MKVSLLFLTIIAVSLTLVGCKNDKTPEEPKPFEISSEVTELTRSGVVISVRVKMPATYIHYRDHLDVQTPEQIDIAIEELESIIEKLKSSRQSMSETQAELPEHLLKAEETETEN